MTFHNYHDYNKKRLIIYILQIMTLYNAMILGWNVQKVGDCKYILTKKITEDFDLYDFITTIV